MRGSYLVGRSLGELPDRDDTHGADDSVLVWWTGTDEEPDEVLDLRGRGATPKDVASDWWLDWIRSSLDYRGTDGYPVCVRWTDGEVYAFELEVVPVPTIEARQVEVPRE